MQISSMFTTASILGISSVGATVSQSDLLNITAITGVNGKSVIQCWQLKTPFKTSSEAGTVGARSLPLGNVTTTGLTILPAGFVGTAHPAPAPQYVVFLSGLARFSVPGSNSTGFALGGRDGIIFAADTADLSKEGHISEYLTQTVALEIPTKDRKIPDHMVLHDDACSGLDLLV